MNTSQKEIGYCLAKRPWIKNVREILKLVNCFSGLLGVVLTLILPVLVWLVNFTYSRGIKGYFSYYKIGGIQIESTWNSAFWAVCIAIGVIICILALNLWLYLQFTDSRGKLFHIINGAFVFEMLMAIVICVAIFMTPDILKSPDVTKALVALSLFFVGCAVLLWGIRPELVREHKLEQSACEKNKELKLPEQICGEKAALSFICCVLLICLSYYTLGVEEFKSMSKLLFTVAKGTGIFSVLIVSPLFLVMGKKRDMKRAAIILGGAFLFLIGEAILMAESIGKIAAINKREYDLVIGVQKTDEAFPDKLIIYQTENDLYVVPALCQADKTMIMPGQYQQLDKKGLTIQHVVFSNPPEIVEE
ncbi:hypothetical protein [Allofournierella sp.]|uniref:hypothetical protein n=1 Tax=Allofournierella sp. TaxID=1940256 RepID=UPI003AF1D6F8